MLAAGRGGRAARPTRAAAPPARSPPAGPAPGRRGTGRRSLAPAGAPAPQRASPTAAVRLLRGLLALLRARRCVIVAVVLITAPAPTKVVLRNVVYSDVQQASAALKQLVSENTK